MRRSPRPRRVARDTDRVPAIARRTPQKDLCRGAVDRATPRLPRYLIESLEARRLLSAGQLDTTFNNGQVLHSDFTGRLDEATDVAVQPDGKIVVVGSSSTDGSFGGEFAVLRYNADGTRDTTFNGGGILIDFGGEEAATAVALQPDGKILVGGYTGVGSDYDFIVFRFNPDGTPDTTFGAPFGGASGGFVATDFGGLSNDRLNDLLVQPDGKIVAVGLATPPSTGNTLGVARYNPDGSLDFTFSGDGLFNGNPFQNQPGEGFKVARQSDGKLVIAAKGNSGGFITVGLYRLNTNGTLDTTFDGDGFLHHGVGTTEPQGLAIAADGGILVAATIQTSPALTQLIKYTSTGAVQTSFGPNGTGRVDVSSGGFFGTPIGLGVMPSGKIVVAATSSASGGSFGQWTLARLNSNGTFDNTFGTNGKTNLSPGAQAEVKALALQGDGRIVVAGYNNFDVAVARFTNDDAPTSAGTISGRRFEDRNADGVRGASGEPGAPGSSVYLDLNNNGVWDPPSGGTPLTQTFQSADVPKNTPSVGTVNSTLNVAGFNYLVGDINVSLTINHPWVPDLDVFLVSPAGTVVELFTDVGQTNTANFTNTVLDDEAATSIATASAPFTGTFRPESPLSVLDGQAAQGTWTLRITDDEDPDGGLLTSWSITIQGATPSGEPITTTDANGDYAFTNLAPGTYVVRDLPATGQLRTVPSGNGAHTVILAAGQSATGRDFGFFPTIFTGTSADDSYTVRRDPANTARTEILVNNTPTYSIARSSLGNLTFNLLAGADQLTVDFTYGDPVPANFGIRFDGGSNPAGGFNDRLILFGSSAADFIALVNPLVVPVGQNIGLTSVEQTHFTDAGGNDTLTLGVALFTNVTVNGGPGQDTLVYNASEGDDTLTITDGSLSDGSFTHTFGAFESILANARFGFDTVNVTQSPSAPATLVDLGDGNDTLTFSGIAGNASPSLGVFGGPGNDTVRITSQLNALPAFSGEAGNDTIEFTAGAYTLGANLGANAEDLKVSNTAHLSFTVSPTFNALSLLGGGKLTLTPGGDKTLFAKSLTITGNSLLDLSDHDLVIQAAPTNALLQQLNTYVRSARGPAGDWTGPSGITSANARSDAARLTGLAVAKTADGASALVRYTWAADANADAAVDADDYYVVDRGFLTRSTLFHGGDLNFSGLTDLDDYALLDQVWLSQNPT